jgi:hypothetical protein
MGMDMSVAVDCVFDTIRLLPQEYVDYRAIPFQSKAANHTGRAGFAFV